MNKKDKTRTNYTVPTPTGRHSVWLILLVLDSKPETSLEYLEYLSKNTFIEYKIYMEVIYSKKDKNKIGQKISIIGRTLQRKRLSTLKNRLNEMIERSDVNIHDHLDVAMMSIYRSSLPFQKSAMDGKLIASSSKSSEYEGKDIRLLDDRKNRFPWQNQVIDIFYDEEYEEFINPDDRTIYWIYDLKGNIGKSKLVKWLCVNRPDEIVKIVFGSAQQLRNSLVAIGPRILYLIDIPRSPSNDESFDKMSSSIEELKNGQIVSHMYGKYSQLLLDPPHIIIFANFKCPQHLLSKDRWRIYEVKDGNLTEVNDNHYKLG